MGALDIWLLSGSCSFLYTSILNAGSVAILMCYRGAMKVAKHQQTTSCILIVSNFILI